MSFAPFYIHAGLLLWNKQRWTVQNSPDFVIVAPRIHRDGLICLRTQSVGKARTKAQGSWFVVYWLFCDTIYGGSLEALPQSSVHSQHSALLLGGWGSSFWQLPAAFLTEDCPWLQETALAKVMPPSQRVSHGERSADLRIQKSDSPLSDLRQLWRARAAPEHRVEWAKASAATVFRVSFSCCPILTSLRDCLTGILTNQPSACSSPAWNLFSGNPIQETIWLHAYLLEIWAWKFRGRTRNNVQN